jgi:hypothetical protein
MVFPPGIPHGHTGHVRFLTSVEVDSLDDSIKSINSKSNNDTNTTAGNQILVISGGDGYEDFRNSGNTTMSEVAGREDSTNHLLLWQL